LVWRAVGKKSRRRMAFCHSRARLKHAPGNP
jgi:hypothetical protein